MVGWRQYAPSLFFAALILGSASAASAHVWKRVIPEARARAASISSDGVKVTIAMPDQYDLREGTLTSAGSVTIRFPRMRPFRLPNGAPREAHYGISVGIGKLWRNDLQPTIFIRGYTGGAHCCDTLQIVSVLRGQIVVDKLPPTDTSGFDAFPTDIDGDGAADIRWVDDSLLYEFGGYAGSWHVPRLYNVRNGHPVDVSREPRYAPIYRAFTKRAFDSCRNNTTPENGDCAAYAYAKAILGQPEEGIRAAAKLARPPGFLGLPEDCEISFDEEGNCPEGRLITFNAFEPALRYLMRKNGYLP